MTSLDRRRVTSGSPYEPMIGFSRAIRVGDRVWVSGTAPVWPDEHVDPDPAAQMRRCVEIALASMRELGASAGDVVRTRIFLTDADDGEAIGRVHTDTFGDAAPAATMVVVAGLLDPRWKVEVEVEAVVDT
jgi:enamine deaminase RidA (YjgF/YER057c/UK114 family)